MCRLVVYAKDTNGFKAGDVVKAVEDGVFLGKDIERGHPGDGVSWWRIVEMPGVPVADAAVQALLYRDPGDSNIPFTTKLGLVTPKRQRKVDLPALETAAAVKTVSDKITTTKVAIVASTTTKPTTATTDVIG